jgi:hypothetical protein
MPAGKVTFATASSPSPKLAIRVALRAGGGDVQGARHGIQLRSYDLGGTSGALMDCAAVGLPTVTNASLGAAVGVPDYVRCIPDELSPPILAAALADLLAGDFAVNRPEELRRKYSEERSLRTYSIELFKILGLDPTSRLSASGV